jgi:hypothetical protein
LSASVWIDVTTVAGNNGVMMLSHTNGADRSFYRLKLY